MFLLDVFNGGYNHNQSENFLNNKTMWITSFEGFSVMCLMHAQF